MAISESRSLDLRLYLGREINDVCFGGGFHRNAMYFNGHEPILLGEISPDFSLSQA